MIYIIKEIGDFRPYCITAIKKFAIDIIETERKDGRELFCFECKDIHDVALIVSDEYVKSIEMFYDTK